MSYKHKPLYLDQYPSLDLFLVGYIAVRNIEEKTNEENARRVGSSNEDFARAIISDIDLILQESNFPLKKLSDAANINFHNSIEETKTWLLEMKNFLSEELIK